MYHGLLPATSNRADWEQSFTLVDEASGEPIDISGCRITLSVIYRPRNPNYWPLGSYYYDSPPQQYGGLVLTGSTDTGEITLPGDMGTFTWLFPASRMAGLWNGEYQIGLRLGQNGSTTQLMIGTIPVYEGFDMQ
jgi:hypothetical protein